MMNQLKNTKSLYLRQHSDNPVSWFEWTEAAFKHAEKENKPILLSIGYSTCHWCHVMAHESFEDAETAALINENFISIKVDREERPDIDLMYQQVLAVTGEPGGWPLTVFLTPKGEAFFGGTYFPPKPMYGRPSFKDILKGVASSWAQEQDKIEYNVAAISQALKQESQSKSGDMPDQSNLDSTVMKLISGFDPKHGGFGSAPKFPQVPLIDFVWSYSKKSDDDIFRKASLITLDNICQGGLYDHIGGGFFRYSTDEKWLVPHFEKMLYDNALIIPLLTDAYVSTKNPLYKARVFETIDWILSDMSLSDTPCLAAALDADNDEGEGAYYTWAKQDVDDALGIDAIEFDKIYDVTDSGNWQESIILNRLAHQPFFNEKKEGQLRAALNTLKEIRNKRSKPARDDKVLTDWNAMAVIALIKAAKVFDKPEWIDRAKQIFDALNKEIVHCRIDGEVTSKALLDDYIWVMSAAMNLYQTDFDKTYIDCAIDIYNQIKSEFSDVDKGGFFLSRDAIAEHRIKTINDTAIPSANAVLIHTLTDLAALTLDQKIAQDAEDLIKTFAGEIDLAPFAMGGYLSGIHRYINSMNIKIHAPDLNAAQPFIKAVSTQTTIHHVIEYITDDKTFVDVCYNCTCYPPIKTVDDLKKCLETLPSL